MGSESKEGMELPCPCPRGGPVLRFSGLPAVLAYVPLQLSHPLWAVWCDLWNAHGLSEMRKEAFCVSNNGTESLQNQNARGGR